MNTKNFNHQKVSYLSEFQQKSLKQLFLKHQKNNLIDQILTILIDKHKLKISERSTFLLTNFVNYYQMLYKIMDYNANHVTRYVQNLKQQKIKKGFILPKFVLNQKNTQKANFKKIISQSYKCKCFQQFFGLSNYTQEKIVQTVVDKILQKIRKGQIKIIQNQANNSKKVSICIPNNQFNFELKQQTNLNKNKRKQLYKINEQNKEEKEDLSLRIQLKNKQNIYKNITGRKNKQLKSQRAEMPQIRRINFNNRNSNISQSDQKQKCCKNYKSKVFQTSKSVNSLQSRRNGFHQVNKISIQIVLFKDSFKNSQITNEQLMQLGISIKNRLNFLLDNLKVKSLLQKKKEKQIRKIR